METLFVFGTHYNNDNLRTHSSPAEPLTITVERLSVNPVRYNSVSRGLPSTSVDWTVPDDQNPKNYQSSQSLRDGTTSTYDNILTANLELESTTGFYRCDINSEETSVTTAQSTTTVCEQ